MSAAELVGRWVGYYEGQLDAGWSQVQGWTQEQYADLTADFLAMVRRVGEQLGRIQGRLAAISPLLPPNEAQALWEDYAGASAWYTAVLQTWRDLTQPKGEAGFPPAAIVAVVVVAGVTITVTVAAAAWAFVTYRDSRAREAQLGSFEKELELRREVFERTGKLPPSELPKDPPPGDSGVGWFVGLAAVGAAGVAAWWFMRSRAA